MTPETVEAIKEALSPIAAKIGQGAEFGWEVVLRQQYVVAIGDFIFALVSLLVAVLGYKMYRNSLDKDWYNSMKVEGIVLMGIALATASYLIFDGLAHVINPEYYALQFFIQLVK